MTRLEMREALEAVQRSLDDGKTPPNYCDGPLQLAIIWWLKEELTPESVRTVKIPISEDTNLIIGVSIVDKHKPAGGKHVGTYMFEIEYPGDSHFDFLTVSCDPKEEANLRPYLNRLLTADEIPKGE